MSVFLVNRINKKFDRDRAVKLYEQNKHCLGNEVDFDELLDSDWFFEAFDGDEFFGCLYVCLEERGGRLIPFYNGFSLRKKAKQNREALSILLDLLFQNFDVAATYTPHRWAKFFNASMGLKHYDENTYFINKPKEKNV
jgi:hypothetical protein